MARSAPFSRVSSCLARAFAVGIAASSLLLAGCDSPTSKTDKEVSKQLDDASALANGSEANRAAAHQLLDGAAKETDASLPVRLRAKVLLADSELRTAQDLVGQVQGNDVLIDRLVREIGLLSDEIANNNRQAVALAKYDPKNLQDVVAQKQADLKGSDSKPDWYKSGDSALASLSANDKQAADLQAQISQLQDKIKTESDQRNQWMDEADKDSQHSNHEQKEKSVDLYVQGADLRKKAADLSVTLDQDNLALTRAQADLAVRQGQRESLTAANKVFDDKSAFFTQDWTATQAKIAELNAKSKAILGEDPVTLPGKDAKTGDLSAGTTIGSKAAAIRALADKNHDLRGLAETHFNSASAFYKNAVELSQQLQQELNDKLSKKPDPTQSADGIAFTDEKAAMDPAKFRYMEADADFQKGEFFARNATEQKTRLDLLERIKPILAAAQLTAFPTLDDSDGMIAKSMKDAQGSAREAFSDSTEMFTKIYEGTGTPDQRAGGQIQEIFAQYAWWAMETAAGDPKAGDHLTFARNAVSAAVGDSLSLPPLPAELANVGPSVPVQKP